MTNTKRMIVDNIFLGFQKSGTKSRGVLHFVPLQRFYDILFVPLFCRPREKCGILWKTTWLHNVDNIRQKDIKINIYWYYKFCNKKYTMCNWTETEFHNWSSTKLRKAVVITWPHHVMRRRLGLDRVSSFPTCNMDSVSTLPRHRRRCQKIGTLFLSIWIVNKGMRFSQQGRTSHALIISKDILQVGRGQRKPQQDDQHSEQVDERKWGPLYGCLWRRPTLIAMRTGIQEWGTRDKTSSQPPVRKGLGMGVQRTRVRGRGRLDAYSIMYPLSRTWRPPLATLWEWVGGKDTLLWTDQGGSVGRENLKNNSQPTSQPLNGRHGFM